MSVNNINVNSKNAISGINNYNIFRDYLLSKEYLNSFFNTIVFTYQINTLNFSIPFFINSYGNFQFSEIFPTVTHLLYIRVKNTAVPISFYKILTDDNGDLLSNELIYEDDEFTSEDKYKKVEISPIQLKKNEYIGVTGYI